MLSETYKNCWSFWQLPAVLAILAVLFIGSANTSWADIKSGREAFEKGDYATALKESRSLAKKGDAEAQNALGAMYIQGLGVKQDLQEGMKWLRLSAEQGFSEALFAMGMLYSEGKGIEKSDIEAYKWYLLAASKGDSMAAGIAKLAMTGLEEKLSKEQKAKAVDDAKTWGQKHGIKITQEALSPPKTEFRMMDQKEAEQFQKDMEKLAKEGKVVSAQKDSTLTSNESTMSKPINKKRSSLDTDKRHCLDLETNEAIARCADK